MAYSIEGKEVILLGDTTTHGGKVITASETHKYMGTPIARVGDMVECPKCKGTYPIIEGAPRAFDHGKAIPDMVTRWLAGQRSYRGEIGRRLLRMTADPHGLKKRSMPLLRLALCPMRGKYRRKPHLRRNGIGMQRWNVFGDLSDFLPWTGREIVPDMSAKP